MLIFADQPLNLQVIKLLLEILQIKHLSIRAGISNSKRLEAENEYNENPILKVLVYSSRSAAESINL